jgi:hypothetical protein
MGAAVSKFIETLVQEEVSRIVAEAMQGREILSASKHARQILRTYPSCGMNEREIADRIIMSASNRGVVVQIGSNDGHPELSLDPHLPRPAVALWNGNADGIGPAGK